MEPLLKIYHQRYLSEVRHLKRSTVRHYCDALNIGKEFADFILR